MHTIEHHFDSSSIPDEKLGVFAVLGLVGVAADWLNLAVFSLIVAESTVFCRLKFEFVLVWLLFVEVRGTAVGGPRQIRVDTGKCYNRILGIAQLHSF